MVFFSEAGDVLTLSLVMKDALGKLQKVECVVRIVSKTS